MRRQSKLVDLKIMGEINLTPMMDLTFVLLITFIITFPLIEKGVPVKLPSGEGEPIESPEAVSVTIDAGGDLYLGTIRTTRDDLFAALDNARAANPATEVQLRADGSVRYDQLMSVVQILKRAKIANMGLVTDGDTEETP